MKQDHGIFYGFGSCKAAIESAQRESASVDEDLTLAVFRAPIGDGLASGEPYARVRCAQVEIVAAPEPTDGGRCYWHGKAEDVHATPAA